MTKEQTPADLSPLHQPPDKPHLEDELTVLKARPVVPLKQFNERVQRKRKWFLFGMFALSMFLGAASGLISAYFTTREVSEEPAIQLDLATLRAPEESLNSTVSEEPDISNGFRNLLPSLPSLQEQQLKRFTPKRRVIKPRQVSINTKHSVPLPSLSEEEELRRIREALLADDSRSRRVRPTEKREQRRF